MPQYRSRTSTHGRNMAGARSLWRATGMKDGDFGKPIIAVVNSFTQFVPGHVHLKDLGQLVAREIEAAGGVAKEFNTIAVDDGIAMGHGGMLYSLPSRELIADSVEYMANAHCADALVCISNCDKITPGMLMAALRLNIPAIFVSGGPMEAGKVKIGGKVISLDLVDAMVKAADSKCSDEEVEAVERSACPTCGSCSGMFTANSMNCLTEALGLSLPGNGTLVATHADRKSLFLGAGQRIVELCKRYYEQDDASVLPRNVANKKAFENAMALDVAMGGSTNTVLHILAAAQEAGVDFTMQDIDRISRHVPCLCKVAPMTEKYHIEDVHRAGGILGLLAELGRNTETVDNKNALFGQIADLSREANIEIRTMMNSLESRNMTWQGLFAEIRQYASLVLEPRGIAFDLTLTGVPGADPDMTDATAIFRIVKEAIANSSKHAHATKVAVEFRFSSRLELFIRDDGRWNRDAAEGRGLRHMRQCVQAMGGYFQIQTQPSTQLVCLLPTHVAAQTVPATEQ